LPFDPRKETGLPHFSTVAFISYWRGLQTEPDRAPPRERFDPGELRRLIPQMIMLSTLDPEHRFRLTGGFLTALHGRELKSASFHALFRPAHIDAVAAALILARRREQPLVFTLAADWESPAREDDDLFQKETLEMEICLCPLRNADGAVDRMVGLCQTLSPPPRRLTGRPGLYRLGAARLYAPGRQIRAAHLQLIAADGKRIA
jgi:hypothetical protein